MAEEKETLQVNQNRNISWKISLSAVFWRQQQWERASLCGATLWRDLSQQGRVRVRGCQERCNPMIMSPNTSCSSLSFSFNSLIALAVWALPWLLAADREAGQKWKSWAGHHTSACYASPLGRAWGNLMFGGKAASSGRCPLMTSLTFPPALSKSWNWPKVFAVIAKKYHDSTNSVRWLGISDLVEQLKCVLCQILDPGGRDENYLLFASFVCLLASNVPLQLAECLI